MNITSRMTWLVVGRRGHGCLLGWLILSGILLEYRHSRALPHEMRVAAVFRSELQSTLHGHPCRPCKSRRPSS